MKKIQAFEMMKCGHCGELREPSRTRGNHMCGSCRDDSMKSVIICGACEEREAQDDKEVCDTCEKEAAKLCRTEGCKAFADEPGGYCGLCEKRRDDAQELAGDFRKGQR